MYGIVYFCSFFYGDVIISKYVNNERDSPLKTCSFQSIVNIREHILREKKMCILALNWNQDHINEV